MVSHNVFECAKASINFRATQQSKIPVCKNWYTFVNFMPSLAYTTIILAGIFVIYLSSIPADVPFLSILIFHLRPLLWSRFVSFHSDVSVLSSFIKVQ
ncbi:unnamed protein product [Trichobilharzia szidati]|nr:unnamed protein product [Trichobilharzia szidati]